MTGEKLGGYGQKSELEEMVERSTEIHEKCKEAFGDDLSPIPLSYFGEKAFSGDGATLFMLVNIEEKPTLVKVGWGEFSADLFTPGAKIHVLKQEDDSWHNEKYKQHKRVLVELLRNFSLPLYCVGQHDSWLAEDEDKELMINDPVEYLRRNAIFCAKNGKVTIAENLIDKLRNREGTREDLRRTFGRHKWHRLNYPIEPADEGEVFEALNATKQMRESLEAEFDS